MIKFGNHLPFKICDMHKGKSRLMIPRQIQSLGVAHMSRCEFAVKHCMNMSTHVHIHAARCNLHANYAYDTYAT